MPFVRSDAVELQALQKVETRLEIHFEALRGGERDASEKRVRTSRISSSLMQPAISFLFLKMSSEAPISRCGCVRFAGG